jgi:hypothetical protein
LSELHLPFTANADQMDMTKQIPNWAEGDVDRQAQGSANHAG